MSARLEAIKLRGGIRSDRQLEVPRLPPELPEGEVELILLYQREQASALSPISWPALEGGQYLGGALRREEFYGDDGR